MGRVSISKGIRLLIVNVDDSYPVLSLSLFLLDAPVYGN